MILLFALFAGCGSDKEAAFDSYVQVCQPVQERGCERAFECDSILITGRYNSLAHCKNEVVANLRQAARELAPRRLDACAGACRVMQTDLEQTACEDLNKLLTTQYSCGE